MGLSRLSEAKLSGVLSLSLSLRERETEEEEEMGDYEAAESTRSPTTPIADVPTDTTYVRGIATGPLTTLNGPSAALPRCRSAAPPLTLARALCLRLDTIQRLVVAMEANPEHVDSPAQSRLLDSAAKRLLDACAMIEHRSVVAGGADKGKARPEEDTPESAVKHGVGFRTITPIGVANLHSRFDQADADESATLSIPEITRCAASSALPSSVPPCCLCLTPRTLPLPAPSE